MIGSSCWFWMSWGRSWFWSGFWCKCFLVVLFFCCGGGIIKISFNICLLDGEGVSLFFYLFESFCFVGEGFVV